MSEQKIVTARVAALFRVARPAYFATLANAVLLLLVLWEAFPVTLLLAWFGGVVAVTLARVGLHRAYARGAGRHTPYRWEALFALGAIAAGALWAYPPAVFLPVSDPLFQMAVIFVVGGTIIGAAGVYAPSPAVFYGFCVPPFAAIIVQLAAQSGRTYALLALMVAVFGVVMVRVYRDIHDGILRTLRTQIENEELVGRLARSEAQLRDAIDSFPEGIAVYDADDRLLVCNEIYARVYGAGKSAAELTGAPYPVIAQNAFAAEVVPPEDADRYAQWLEERLARRRSGAGLVRHYKLRDGRSLQGLFVRSRAGGIVSMFTDITELRHAQDAYSQVLSKSEATYRNLVETSNDLIWSVDGAGRWTYLSPAAVRRIYGCEPSEMFGREFSGVLAPETGERDVAVL
ncbi:MAG: PAS domain S-box protein, partial [Betaproteobacteria bacterium]|nr:PAS domain S-box protein [Betaproteobacteria bacterium]